MYCSVIILNNNNNNNYCAGRHALPPRAHSHEGFSSSESAAGVASPPLPLPQGGLGLGSLMRHDPPPPTSLLDRFRPSTALGVSPPELPVNLLSPAAAAAAAPPVAGTMEPVSMAAVRRPSVTGRNHLAMPGPSATKIHRAIKCYHCRMCEQVTYCVVNLVVVVVVVVVVVFPVFLTHGVS